MLSRTKLSMTAFVVMSASVHAVTLHHQGVIAVQGHRFTGTGAFRFALVDPNSNAYLWVNDGSTVVHPDPPTNAVALPVVNGVYDVRLGDASQINMTDIPQFLFPQNPNVVLRIWFDDNAGNGVHPLSPDLLIDSVPRAVEAQTATQLVDPDTGFAIAAKAADTVFVCGSPFVLPCGDLEVQAGNTVLSGDLTVMGAFTNFSVSGPHSVTRQNSGASSVSMFLTSEAFCSLTSQAIGGLDDFGDTGSCRVRIIADRWVLTATLSEDLLDDGQVDCEAHCFVFSTK